MPFTNRVVGPARFLCEVRLRYSASGLKPTLRTGFSAPAEPVPWIVDPIAIGCVLR